MSRVVSPRHGLTSPCLTILISEPSVHAGNREAAVGPIAHQHGAVTRIMAAVVACLLLLQVAVAGAAVTAVDGAICATEKARSPDGPPVVPNGGRRHSLCCILHCDALDTPPAKPQLSYVLNFPAEAIAPELAMSAPAPRVESRRRPQSPRAPPFAG